MLWDNYSYGFILIVCNFTCTLSRSECECTFDIISSLFSVVVFSPFAKQYTFM